jgi:hypothetical protein
MPAILTMLIIALLIIISLVMAYGKLELESMVVEATITITTVTGSTNADLVDDAAGVAAARELPAGFTKKIIEVDITNPTGAARTVTLFAADPGNQERLAITPPIAVAANTTVTVGLDDVEKPWRKVQPDDLTGIGPPADRFQTQLRANQDALPGAGCVLTARYYDSKYPY